MDKFVIRVEVSDDVATASVKIEARLSAPTGQCAVFTHRIPTHSLVEMRDSSYAVRTAVLQAVRAVIEDARG